MRTQQENVQYLYNLASTMIQQLRVMEIMHNLDSGPQDFYPNFSNEIKAKLAMMNPETRGRIADLGISYEHHHKEEIPMYLVHCGSFLDKYLSGRELVTEIACTTIVAKMAEIFQQKRVDCVAEIRAEDEANLRM